MVWVANDSKLWIANDCICIQLCLRFAKDTNGKAGIQFDSSVFRKFIKLPLKVANPLTNPPRIPVISTTRNGEPTPNMVPLPRFTTVSGLPITHFIGEERLNEIIERAKKGGGELVGLMGTSACHVNT